MESGADSAFCLVFSRGFGLLLGVVECPSSPVVFL